MRRWMRLRPSSPTTPPRPSPHPTPAGARSRAQCHTSSVRCRRRGRSARAPLLPAGMGGGPRAGGEDGCTVDAAHMLASVVPPRPGGPLRVAAQSEQPRAQRWLGSLHNNIGLDPLRHNARKPWNNSSGLYPCDADKAMRRLSALRSGRLPRRSGFCTAPQRHSSRRCYKPPGRGQERSLGVRGIG